MSAVEAIRPDDEFQKFRPLAAVRDWSDLIQAFRTRFEQLGASRITIDEVAGMAAGYSSKLLSTAPIKRTVKNGKIVRNSVRSFGRTSLGPLLGTAGLVLIVAEDPELTACMRKRLTRRQSNMARSHPTIVRIKGKAKT